MRAPRILPAVLLPAFVALQSAAKDQSNPHVQALGQLKTRIAEALAKHGQYGSAADAYSTTQAQARIEAVGTMLAERPDDKNVSAMFVSCSLMVETAVVELALAEQRARADALRDRTNAALGEINSIHESIAHIERSKTTKLKADLNAEKERAQKLREEAQRRFNDLQSELISVKRDARGTIISMSDILFAVDKATLTNDLKTNLAKIAGILTVFKGSQIIVEGHTDNQGSEEYNQKLSEQRAENVMNFLADQGVSAQRLTSTGYGFTRPVADNGTAEGRQKNRRVDLVIQDTAQKETEESDW